VDHPAREPDPDTSGEAEAALADGFQELCFDADRHDPDPFMESFRGMPESEDAGGARHNPFLRVAFGRKLLNYEQERELGRRLNESRIQMTEALSAFEACHRHLIAEWDKAVLGERPPGEVLQWPSGAPTAASGDAPGRDAAPRARMASLAMRHSCWVKSCNGETGLDAPLDLRALFVDAAPAFSMLCELRELAGHALDAVPARSKGRAGLQRALEAAAAAELRFQDARRVMLESNLRLVFSIAGKFINNGIAYDDLVQEGSIGLLRAIEKFEPALGFKFSTYASTWIWQAVTRAIANQRRTVRVPAHIHDKMIKVRGVAARMQQRTGVEPSVAELSAACELAPEVVSRALSAANRALSLDAPVRAGEDTSLLDLAADPDQVDSVDSVQREQLRNIVRRELARLPEREAVILSLRLGLGGRQEHTLEEIGVVLGITRERTRQLQNRALEALRERLQDFSVAP
jgi:RNA polymerase primary sigma factor